MKANPPPLHLGFIGCGGITEYGHLPALRSVPGVKVAAIADVDPYRLQRLGDRYGITRRHATSKALIEDSTIEAVGVCVPAPSHAALALEVLDAGKHLFLEKPLALTLNDCDALIRRSASLPAKIMVGFNLRWHRLIAEARADIARGGLGELELVRSVLTSGARYAESAPIWRSRRATGGGEFLETAVHHFDLWRFLLGTEIAEVFATSRSGAWDDESVAIAARLENGVLATAAFSAVTSDSHAMEIYGRSGRLSISLLNFGGLKETPVGKPRGAAREGLRAVGRFWGSFPHRALRARRGGDTVLSYAGEWRHFLAAIRDGAQPECSLIDGRRALQAALAAIEAASRGTPVRIDAFDGTSAPPSKTAPSGLTGR